MAILDFSKAFYKVAHARLIHKLDFYGIRGTLLHWINSFLTNHTQQVVVSGDHSSPCLVTSGVPQRSVLGPVLLLMYVNDITENIQSQMRSFADDCLIYHTVTSTQDHTILQDDLNALTTWANAWQMEFNVSKCKILQISIRNRHIYSYSMNGITLESVDSHI